jgi:predicted ATP-grasp superfamily ATP-dependent carboligase
MNELRSQENEMTSAAFAQMALRERVAPPSIGSVKQRIHYAARKLGWKYSRAKAAWYADERITIKADEMCDIERTSGLQYTRQEMRTNDKLIAKIDAFMEGHDASFYSAFRTAFRSVLGIPDRARTQGDR